MKKRFTEKRCSECNAYMTRGFHILNNHYLCYKCYIKKRTILGRNKSIEEALNRVYKIKGYLTKQGYVISSSINVPQVLIGKKVKIILYDEPKNTKINGRKKQT